MTGATRSKKAWAGSGLPLVVWTALAHPNAELRGRVRHELEQWIDAGGPAWSSSDVERALAAATGSAVAPFRLSRAGVEAAVIVARILFSQRVKGTRFRIASEDSLWGDYGIVLTNHLNHYVAGRRIGEKPSRKSGVSATLVHSELDRAAPAVQGARTYGWVEAALHVTDHGISIAVASGVWQELPLPLHRAAQASGVLGGKAFTELGLAVSVNPSRITIVPTGPEAVIRLSALQAARKVLILDSGIRDDDHGPPAIALRLDLPHAENDVVPLNAITAWRLPELNLWLRFSDAMAGELPESLRRLVVTEVAMHRGLLDSEILESLA
jgi:hypothetical protein